MHSLPGYRGWGVTQSRSDPICVSTAPSSCAQQEVSGSKAGRKEAPAAAGLRDVLGTRHRWCCRVTVKVRWQGDNVVQEGPGPRTCSPASYFLLCLLSRLPGRATPVTSSLCSSWKGLVETPQGAPKTRQLNVRMTRSRSVPRQAKKGLWGLPSPLGVAVSDDTAAGHLEQR